MNTNYKDHIGKYIYCIKTDKGFGIRKGKGYKILLIEENNGEYFYNIMTEKISQFPNGISFKVVSKSFLSVEESMVKLRTMKWERILGGNEDQMILT